MALEMFESARSSRLADCGILDFPLLDTGKGPLVSIDFAEELPFEVRRMYYFKRGKEDVARGNHANFENRQVIVALQGSFEVLLMDGYGEQTIHLREANKGLVIREGIWRTVQRFSPDAIGLVLCSHAFLAEDYWGDFQAFLAWKRGGENLIA